MKDRPSKLDPHAARLEAWFGEESRTLEWVRSQLAEDGLDVSLNALSQWWQSRQRELLQERLLGNIANGSRRSAEIEREFRQHAAPELETLVKLLRVLILQLSTDANANPELLELVVGLIKPVLEHEKIGIKREQVALDREKLTASQRTKIDAGLEAIKASLLGNEEAMKHWERMKLALGS